MTSWWTSSESTRPARWATSRSGADQCNLRRTLHLLPTSRPIVGGMFDRGEGRDPREPFGRATQLMTGHVRVRLVR